MRTLLILVCATTALTLSATRAPSEDKKDPKAKKDPPKTAEAKLMAQKLQHAQKLLDGLTTNDFDKIGKAAEELMLISKAAEFSALKTRQYELHTNSFREALTTISKKAKEKNLDGATLAYVDMTLTCVRCHQHTREERNARLPGNLPLLANRE